jgi:hypothetical protein
MMDLFHNPFKILEVSMRDDRSHITEIAEERSLLIDADECSNARFVLTNPRKRLAAEISWLPGLAPKNIDSIFSILNSSPSIIVEQLNLPPMARTNLLVAAIKRLPEYNKENLSRWILEIAKSFEEISSEQVLKTINEERLVAGFPDIVDLSLIEDEIKERRIYFKGILKSVLDNLAPKKLVETITDIVNLTTNGGNSYCPYIISDLVDIYEIEAQIFFEKEEGNIRTLVEKINRTADKQNCDTLLLKMVSELIKIIKNWYFVAQPLQIYAKAKGMRHDKSFDVAVLVRGLAISLFNDYNKLDIAQQLSEILQDVFADVEEVTELVDNDISILEDIREQREDLSYEADVGIIFKDKLSISPEWIEWKGRRWSTKSVTRVRWGGTRHSVNGIPTGTTYTIIFGDNNEYTSIELANGTIYSNFTDCLWKTVGIRLLTEYLTGLREGNSYRFSSVLVSDLGMELERRKLFSSNERVFCKWGELIISNGAGVFCIGKKDDKRLSVALSYLEEDNIHVFENAIRLFWKRGGYRLSSILDPDK